ncbi:MAG: PepSY domain-containing protein [Burkholderiales bacterium]|nr:PepSY domain-containing protein [Burkholderiales bacterium]
MVGGRPNEDRPMNRYARSAAAIALTVAAGVAVAGASEGPSGNGLRADRCAAAPRGDFRPAADLRAAVEGFGYQVLRVDTDAGCYAVLAADQRGKRYDMRFEGASLRMVSRYVAKPESSVVARR